jgi:hypothetical protein
VCVCVCACVCVRVCVCVCARVCDIVSLLHSSVEGALAFVLSFVELIFVISDTVEGILTVLGL